MPPIHILTFDIEDWFHFLDNKSTKNAKQWISFEPRVRQSTFNILEFLEKHNQKATFFILGWIAEQNPGMVKEIANAGHEIGLHSYGHQLIWQQTYDEFRNDLLMNISILEDQLGQKVDKYRAPGFSLKRKTLWALDVLAEAGITTDASVFPSIHAHGGIPSFSCNSPCLIEYNGHTIKEFPINYKQLFGIRIVFSGGGYFRLWPYGLIRNFTEKSPYVMSYFHPHDFDLDQPILNGLSALRRFRAYYGLDDCQQKLERWISEYSFTDLQSADKNIDWSKVPKIKL
ncbi:MAG: polysaccharide deacetylase family protein [Bacteroidales bacterium]